MKSIGSSLTFLLAAAALALSIYTFLQIRKPKAAGGDSNTHSTFDRVTMEKTIRVGYLIEPPYMYKNTSTGKISGIFYDVMEEIGRKLNCKILWVEEVNLATLSEGIDNARYDMIAFPLWRSSDRAKKVTFSTPLFYSTVGCYARFDDHRFDTGLAAINSTNIRVSTIDGELAEQIAKDEFPKATLVALPPLSDYSQMLLQVADKKADVTFHNRVYAARYIKKNPGTVKEVTKAPMRVFAECYILPINDYKFQTLINETIAEIVENGYLDKAFRDNGEDPAEYYMTIPPYKTPRN